ncbi:MAG: class I SAM-dependent methyltransferase [Haliscomenobacter sp.]|uniref:class I SAM-dependent methyltransferase n=1 Tax=Haliscomenobacter sp. TaxID=2717303 RepID=UPI0029B8E777|nr:class I SAM-dependent methyltransferase [Haliscomenobacter sp.]MDX2070370.1 class I SAM-dependent methyltransferase [Haliscomenobacter sp.]
MNENLLEFENRLQKVDRHISKWARRQGVTCYRVYDNDLTNFPLVIDRYEQAVHVAEYQRQHSLDEFQHQAWLEACLDIIAKILEVPRFLVFFKERKRQKGQQQYEKVDTEKHQRLVQENGLNFLVNLSDYLDTGLFLDHRNTRQMVREQAEGQHFLNLFAYTGSFTVYAAAGGALTTTTVDLSNTYLDWAEANLRVNNFADQIGQKHYLIKADVKQYLDTLRSGQFDLVVMDPPTFSNSKMMKEVLDTQRDHVDLLNQVIFATRPGGIIYFSTNYRSFKLDEANIKGVEIEEISQRTIPQDFRNKKIHRCFRMQCVG